MPVTSVIGNRGFTLMELLVVLAILVLLAGAWPFAASRLFPRQQLRDEAQRFLAEARVTRTAARTGGAPQVIEIAEAGNAYRTAAGNHDLARGISVHLRDSENAAPARRVTLYPDGSATGGIVDFSLSDRLLSVSVARLTGKVEILE